MLDRLLSFINRHSSWFESVAEGRPLIILKDGKPLDDCMERSGVDRTCSPPLDRLEQIKFAILERSGLITIIPRESTS